MAGDPLPPGSPYGQNSEWGRMTEEERRQAQAGFEDASARAAAGDKSPVNRYDERQSVAPGGSDIAWGAGQRRYADKTASQPLYGANVAADRRRQQIGITDLDLAYKRAQQAASGNDAYSLAAAQRARQQYEASVRGGVALSSSVPMAQRALAERRAQMAAATGQAQNENAIASARAAYMSQAQDRMAELAKARMEANLANTGAYGNELAEQAKLDADRRLFYTQLMEERERAGVASRQNAYNAAADYDRARASADSRDNASLGGMIGGGIGAVGGGIVGGPAGAAAGYAGGTAVGQYIGTRNEDPKSDPSKKREVFAQAASKMTSGGGKCR